MITVQVKLFSIVKDSVGESSILLDLDDNSTAKDALKKIVHKNDEKLTGLPIRIAVNQCYVDEEYLLDNGDEVAMIPPVSGG
jgi:molybdopterin converting factor subunit 1